MECSISLKKLCDELSISIETGRNWIKLGKITPTCIEKNIPYFSQECVEKLKKDIQSGNNTALKSRRNKKYVSGNVFYHSYLSDTCRNMKNIELLLQEIEEQHLKIEENQMQLLLADCAVKVFVQRFKKEKICFERLLIDFLDGKVSFGERNRLIFDFISDVEAARKWINENPALFRCFYEYEEQEDILGLLYISCSNIGKRKATGSYYTPTRVVQRLLEQLVEKKKDGRKILDPSCGTGNFLLQLPDRFLMEDIYGNDLDPVSVKITRLNLALRYENVDIDLLYRNITNRNYLCEYENKGFDFIIGNPPWGYSFAEKEKQYLREKFSSAEGKNIESYDVFVEQSLLKLREGGVLSFVLPESILNVKSHRNIRKIIAETTFIQYIGFLGNIFDKVQCPCLILQLQNTKKPWSCLGIEIDDGRKKFQLRMERDISPECFSFMMTDEEYQIIKKVNSVSHVTYLKDHAIFAMGIVTGDNKKYISDVKKLNNERILKGSDLHKYQIDETENYIVFRPDAFQQVAPISYYRAPEKLLYRFISDQLVFAYDNQQTLTLNSCNILIPQIAGLKMKYVMAILNSKVAQFIYKKQFHSVKVLRSHLEQIPIPEASQEQQMKVIGYVEQLMSEVQNKREVYETLDDVIRTLYGLNDQEYQLIKDEMLSL